MYISRCIPDPFNQQINQSANQSSREWRLRGDERLKPNNKRNMPAWQITFVCGDRNKQDSQLDHQSIGQGMNKGQNESVLKELVVCSRELFELREKLVRDEQNFVLAAVRTFHLR